MDDISQKIRTHADGNIRARNILAGVVAEKGVEGLNIVIKGTKPGEDVLRQYFKSEQSVDRLVYEIREKVDS